MKIIFLNGDNAGTKVELTPAGLTIGRETDNHLQLPVGGVSRYHARIEFVDDEYLLRDLGSTNGTKLNGVMIQNVEKLKTDDIITIGEQQFRVLDAAVKNENVNTGTVKIPANTPVPEPAAPQFVFRPDAGVQPPPPPPVTDGTETATVNIDPAGLPASGSDFFTRRDVEEGLFQNGEKKKSSGKSTLRGNLIFALVLIVMIAIGAWLFVKMGENQDPGQQANRKAGLRGSENVNNPFFFHYEKQEVDPETKFICKKKFYCRRATDDECKRNGWEKGIYLLEVTFDDLESNRTVFIPACVPAEEMKSIGGKMDTKRFLSDLAASESTDTGDHTTWTRIVVGNGDKINDVIYYDGIGRNNAVFSRMEDTLESFINTIPGSELMAPMKQVLEEADRAFTSATRFYGERHVNPKAFYQALNDYKEAARRYESFSPPPEKLTEARSKINELQKFLKDTHDSALNRMRAAANKKDYDAAHRICVEAMEYFEPGTDAYNRLKENKLKIEDAQRKIMKGK